MLACARIGAIHSVVFGGFAASELASRINDARPKVIVSASCGMEPGRIVAYKPLLGARSNSSRTSRSDAYPPAAAAEADLVPGRDLA
jgi:propionyl-CoA synthetase